MRRARNIPEIRRASQAAAIVLFTCCLLPCGPVFAETIHVAVASNFAAALRLLTVSYRADAASEGAGVEFRISAASTGKLFAQIRHGAPFDVFLAADAGRPARLAELGDAVPETRFTYAIGRLALWRPVAAEDPQQDGPRQNGPWQKGARQETPQLLTETFRRLAMANPKTAPYGKAAEETLRALGLWRGLQPKLVRGENIGQTYRFVASGAAEIGFIALSQLRGGRTPGGDRGNGRLWIVPSSLYTPLRQQVVLLRSGADNAAAREFLVFLGSAGAREIIRAQGYGVVGMEGGGE